MNLPFNLYWPTRPEWRAFFTGMREFRSDFTTHYPVDPDGELALAYDCGRELAHVLTFRRFDPAA